MDSERLERTRQVMRDVAIDRRHWLELIEPGMPDPLELAFRRWLDAYDGADIDALLELTDPQVVITQPPEMPDARSYNGHEGLVEALLDWPRQWEGFAVEPKRVYANGDDELTVVSIHRGRSLAIGIDVEAEVYWVFAFDGEQLTRWQMFMSDPHA